mgnify:CR=1 FL=1
MRDRLVVHEHAMAFRILQIGESERHMPKSAFNDDLRTLHYSAGGTFYPTGEPFKVAMPEGFDD